MENRNVALPINRKTQRTDSSERAKIVFLYGKSMSVNEIAKEIGRSRVCVYRWLKKWINKEPFEPKKPIFNRSSFDEALRTQIKDYALANPTLTLQEYIKKIPLNCAPSTLCKLLVKMKIRSFKAPRKEVLNQSHREIRLLKTTDWVKSTIIDYNQLKLFTKL